MLRHGSIRRWESDVAKKPSQACSMFSYVEKRSEAPLLYGSNGTHRGISNFCFMVALLTAQGDGSLYALFPAINAKFHITWPIFAVDLGHHLISEGFNALCFHCCRQGINSFKEIDGFFRHIKMIIDKPAIQEQRCFSIGTDPDWFRRVTCSVKCILCSSYDTST